MRKTMHKSAVSRWVLLLASASLSACAVGPDYKQPEAFVANQFAGVDASFDSKEVQAQFWTQFADTALAGLVDDALRANHDLRIALANFNASRAIHRESRFDLAPTVTAGAGYTEQLNARELNTVREVSYYDASIDAVWELDIFGGVRRSVERSRAEMQVAEAALRDAQVMVTAEVTRTYFELRGQQQQLQVAQRNVQNQRETLRLIEVRREAGRATELDAVRAQALLAYSSATIAPLQAAIERSIHRLGVLTGRGPQALQAVLATPSELPALPMMATVGDPAGLLRRRPDIRMAERQLAASTANIGVAVADLFPHVTFTGSVGVAALNGSGLGEAGSGTRLVAPGISWAAFDLGRVRARIAAARASNEGVLAHYEQTVLRALEETENSLVDHARARDRLQQLVTAAAASGRAAELARIRYENGIIDFLEVLDSERSLLQAEDQLAQSRTETATTLVAVYKALGGGWTGVSAPR